MSEILSAVNSRLWIYLGRVICGVQIALVYGAPLLLGASYLPAGVRPELHGFWEMTSVALTFGLPVALGHCATYESKVPISNRAIFLGALTIDVVISVLGRVLDIPILPVAAAISSVLVLVFGLIEGYALRSSR